MTPAAMDALRAVVAEMRGKAGAPSGYFHPDNVTDSIEEWADRIESALATPPTSDALTKAVEAVPLPEPASFRYARNGADGIDFLYTAEQMHSYAAASIAAVQAFGVRGEDARCVTAPDGECVSRDACMHDDLGPPTRAARNRLMHAPEQRGVDEAMVERACADYYGDTWKFGMSNDSVNYHQHKMRAALTAALKEQAP